MRVCVLYVCARILCALQLGTVRSEPPGVPSALPVAVAGWLLRVILAAAVFASALAVRLWRRDAILSWRSTVALCCAALSLTVVQVPPYMLAVFVVVALLVPLNLLAAVRVEVVLLVCPWLWISWFRLVLCLCTGCEL